MPKPDKNLGGSAAAVKLAEFAAAVLALADMPHSKLTRNRPVAVDLTPLDKKLLVGRTALQQALKDRLQHAATLLTLNDIAAICLAISEAALDAQGQARTSLYRLAVKVAASLKTVLEETAPTPPKGPSRKAAPSNTYPVKLTLAQRKVVAELFPALAERLKLEEHNQRMIPFTLTKLKGIAQRAGTAQRRADDGMKRNSLRHIEDIARQALTHFQGIGAIPVSERIYQFKITLRNSHSPIWRRIQVRDGTLDKLHEHIQTAMGWTNSHLHHFKIGEQLYGDPMLMEENFEEFAYEDSCSTKLSAILPRTGKRLRLEYEYDFGDSWWHDVLFEGCLRAERGARYPLCVEGARACPPEDVGGTGSYRDYLEAIADPDHERHDEFLNWSGPFDPEAFDPAQATKRMRRGLPDWRSERWI